MNIFEEILFVLFGRIPGRYFKPTCLSIINAVKKRFGDFLILEDDYLEVSPRNYELIKSRGLIVHNEHTPFAFLALDFPPIKIRITPTGNSDIKAFIYRGGSPLELDISPFEVERKGRRLTIKERAR